MSMAIVKIDRNGAEVVQDVALAEYSTNALWCFVTVGQDPASDIRPGDVLVSISKAETTIRYLDRRAEVHEVRVLPAGGKSISARFVRGYDAE
jgi:hypothetical protein